MSRLVLLALLSTGCGTRVANTQDSMDPVVAHVKKMAHHPQGFSLIVKESLGTHPEQNDATIWFVAYQEKDPRGETSYLCRIVSV